MAVALSAWHWSGLVRVGLPAGVDGTERLMPTPALVGMWHSDVTLNPSFLTLQTEVITGPTCWGDGEDGV